MSEQSGLILNDNQELKTWQVSLAEQWQIPHLPQVWCQRKTEGGRVFGRVSLSLAQLEEQAWLNLAQPLRLTVHAEKKPWGQELWYTGIEKRGICSVETPSREKISLPAYLALRENSPRDAQNHKTISAPPLLKILDPHKDESSGCLYIEVHKEKWETYVVTAIDKEAWPTGKGEVLFGFSNVKLQECGHDWQRFLHELKVKIQRYETLRRELDSGSRNKDNQETQHQERMLWNELRNWFDVRQVEIGDVIEVPPGIPHSLQNGVRVVEFQTPTYERLIVAFNQKVQTQNHWDTEEALQFAQRLTSVELTNARPIVAQGAVGETVALDCIVDFPGFRVKRATLARGQHIQLPPHAAHSSGLVFVVAGHVLVNSEGADDTLMLSAEEACYLPQASAAVQVVALKDSPAVILVV